MNHNFLEQGRVILNSQPFSKLMGTELTAIDQGMTELKLPIQETFFQNYGFVHGGVISYLADNCLTFAGATILGHSVTSEYKINYLIPAKGTELVAKASVISFTLRQAVCECKVFANKNSSSTLVAVAQGTIVKIEMENIPGTKK